MVLVKYNLKDVVKALDNGKLYDAKILKIQNIGSKVMYFIHFQGWAPKFDTWIHEDQVSEKSDVDRMKSLEDQISGIAPTKQSVKKNKRPLDPDAVMVVGDDGGPKLDDAAAKEKARADLLAAQFRKRRKQLSMKDMAENEDPAVSAKLNIPLGLKKHLVDEWGLITNDKRLLKLPRPITVEKAIDDYVDGKTKELKNFDEIKDYKDLFGCLKAYFDFALPTILLYRHERAQYDELRAKAAEVGSFNCCQLYGAEHLLRFFVKMPRLMSSVFLPANDVNAIVSKLVDFMGYLNTNFSTHYDNAEYVQAEEAIKSLEQWKTTTKALNDGPKTRHLATRRK